MPAHWDPLRPRPTIIVSTDEDDEEHEEAQPAQQHPTRRGHLSPVARRHSSPLGAGVEMQGIPVTTDSDIDSGTATATRTPNTARTAEGGPSFQLPTQTSINPRPLGFRRTESRDSDVDSNRSHDGSEDGTRSLGEFSDEMETINNSGLYTETDSSPMGAKLGEQEVWMDNRDAEELIQKAAKIRGLRLRYIFIVSFLISAAVFFTVFNLVEAEYRKSVQSAGEVATIRASVRYSDKIMDGIDSFVSIAESGLAVYNASAQLAALGQTDAIPIVDAVLQPALCHSSLGIMSYTVLRRNTTHAHDDEHASGSLFSSWGLGNTSMSDGSEDAHVNDTEGCFTVTETCPTYNASEINNTDLTMLGNLAAPDTCHHAFELTDRMFLHAASSQFFQWILQTRDPDIRVAFTSLRAGVQSYMFGWEPLLEHIQPGVDVDAAWISTAQNVHAHDFVSTHSFADNTSKMKYHLLFTHEDAFPTTAEEEAILSEFDHYCSRGFEHTWHLPYYTDPSSTHTVAARAKMQDIGTALPTLYTSKDSNDVTTKFGFCVVYCAVHSYNVTRCNLSNPDTELTFLFVKTDLSAVAAGAFFKTILAAALSSFGILVLFNIYFHFSIAVPATYLHKRIVSTLSSTRWKPKRWHRAMYFISRPFWVGDLKAIISSFTILAVFYVESRKYMPEHLQRQQVKRLQNAECLIDLINEEKEKEKVAMQSSDQKQQEEGGEPYRADDLSTGRIRPTNSMILTHQNLLRHASFTVANAIADAGGDESPANQTQDLSATELNLSAALERSGLAGTMTAAEPTSPVLSFRYRSDSITQPETAYNTNTGQSNLALVDLVTVMVIHIGYLDEAFTKNFAASEHQHRQIMGTLLSVIRRYGGEVFTRRGESIGVCWNAFERVSNHTPLGVRCAKDISTIFEVVRQQGLTIGIAVHVGPAISGTLGDEGFVMNVVFGETIKKAFLIAELGKQLSCASLLLTEPVKQMVSNKWQCIIVDVLKPEHGGDVEPLFDIRGVASSFSPVEHRRLPPSRSRKKGGKTLADPQAEFLVLYNSAFAQFRRHHFSEAIETLNDLHERCGEDRLSLRLKALCHYAENHQGPVAWPKPYSRHYPEWNLFERTVAIASLDEKEQQAKPGSPLHRGIVPETPTGATVLGVTPSALDLSNIEVPSDSATHSRATPGSTFAVHKTEDAANMEAFRKDLDNAVLQKARSPNFQTPRSVTTPASYPSARASAPPQIDLDDSLYDLRATNYGVTPKSTNGIPPPQTAKCQDAPSMEAFEVALAQSISESVRMMALGGSIGPGAWTGEEQDPAEIPTEFVTHRGTKYTRSNNVLGKGTYGCVYLGMEVHTGRFIAIKFLPLPQDAEEREHIVNEVEIMQTVRDSHIVDFYDFAISGGRIALMMECVVPGSLSSMLKNFETLSPVTTVNFMRDILKGLAKLHARGIIHRDVKPQNVLITSSGACKISDFGASASLGEYVRREAQGAVVGTPLYMAPEAARGQSSQASDIWSVGIMFLELVTGKVPYDMTGELVANPALFVFRIGSGLLTPMIDEERLSPVTLDFVQRCLKPDAEARSTAEDLLSLPFFSV